MSSLSKYTGISDHPLRYAAKALLWPSVRNQLPSNLFTGKGFNSSWSNHVAISSSFFLKGKIGWAEFQLEVKVNLKHNDVPDPFLHKDKNRMK